jgi:hypothetical protein
MEMYDDSLGITKSTSKSTLIVTDLTSKNKKQSLQSFQDAKKSKPQNPSKVQNFLSSEKLLNFSIQCLDYVYSIMILLRILPSSIVQVMLNHHRCVCDDMNFSRNEVVGDNMV